MYKKMIFLLTLMVSPCKTNGMAIDEERCFTIREAGKTANIELAQELLRSGMKVNARGCLGKTMLLHSMSYMYETKDNVIPKEQRLQFMDFLIKQGADLNPKTDYWTESPILEAAHSEIGPDFIALLLKHGVDINYAHPFDRLTALHLAALNGHQSTVNFLVKQKDIQLNKQDDGGMTPLIKAAFWGYAKIVKTLLINGADASMQDESGRTALDYAFSCNKEEKRWRTINTLLKYNKQARRELISKVDSMTKKHGYEVFLGK